MLDQPATDYLASQSFSYQLESCIPLFDSREQKIVIQALLPSSELHTNISQFSDKLHMIYLPLTSTISPGTSSAAGRMEKQPAIIVWHLSCDWQKNDKSVSYLFFLLSFFFKKKNP